MMTDMTLMERETREAPAVAARLATTCGPQLSELGARLIVTRATVTGLLDSLERRGFVHRAPNPADRRSLLVEITPAGPNPGHMIDLQMRQFEVGLAWVKKL